MRTRLIVGALLAFVCLTLLTATAFASVSAGPAVRPQATVKLTSQENMLVKLINKERAKRHLSAVRVQINLMKAARGHSAEMALKKYFSHSSRSGESFGARLVRFGYKRVGFSRWLAGENIYYGTGLYSSPVAAVRAWMKSAGHRAILLNRNIRDIGVGIKLCASGYKGLPNATFFTMDVGRRVR